MTDSSNGGPEMTIGVDVGDKYCQVCVLDAAGEVLEEAGHEVSVANARTPRLIYENDRKSDRVDAQYLARLVRLDPKLLSPLEHRGIQTQKNLELLKAGDMLVATRTRSINHVRGAVKVYGVRVPECSTSGFAKKAAEHLSPEHRAALQPLLDVIRSLKVKIRSYDKRIRQKREAYPQTDLLQQGPGAGPVTALSYVLTIENPHRFSSNRSVGCYVGLTRRESRSGKHDPDLRITKAGDQRVRRLLVQSAHYILGPFGPDTDLRRWGPLLASRGRKNAKKRAVVAVARKLAALMHRLWVTAEEYEPLRRSAKQARAGAPAA